jgi:Fusaric acid resistance protein-like
LDKTLFKAAQRGLGTLVGVATTTAVIEVVNSSPPIVVITLIAGFGAVAFYRANYMIYAFFLTNAVMLYYWLAVDHAVSGPALRLTATIIGIALALAGMALVRSWGAGQRRRRLEIRTTDKAASITPSSPRLLHRALPGLKTGALDARVSDTTYSTLTDPLTPLAETLGGLDRRGGRPAQAGPSSSAMTSTVERALPSSAVQLRCWSRPRTTTRLPLARDSATRNMARAVPPSCGVGGAGDGNRTRVTSLEGASGIFFSV